MCRAALRGRGWSATAERERDRACAPCAVGVVAPRVRRCLLQAMRFAELFDGRRPLALVQEERVAEIEPRLANRRDVVEPGVV